MHELQRLIHSVGARARVLAYDGDTPQTERSEIRQRAKLIVTNPDMLHASILPHHTAVAGLFRGAALMWSSTSCTLTGACLAATWRNVLRRLMRICRFYGRTPRIVCASATIANPLELAEALVAGGLSSCPRAARPRGSATSSSTIRRCWMCALGIRRSAMVDAPPPRQSAASLDLQTILFCAFALARSNSCCAICGRCRARWARPGERARLSRGLSAARAPRDRGGTARAARCAAWWPPTRWSWAWISVAWRPASW